MTDIYLNFLCAHYRISACAAVEQLQRDGYRHQESWTAHVDNQIYKALGAFPYNP